MVINSGRARMVNGAIRPTSAVATTTRNKKKTPMAAFSTILSLDIGTSSVKGSIVLVYPGKEEFKIQTRCHSTYDSNRIRPKNLPSDHSQQRVEIIFESIDNVLKQLKDEIKNPIDLVTVCGQTHGCVFWDQQFSSGQSSYDSLDYSLVSDLYDWTDKRCREDFLRKQLPCPDSYADRISSGFGCATIFWLQKNRPEFLERFQRSGTIMDCFVSVLCGLGQNEPIPIGFNNAHSWGYFDPIKRSWNIEILKEAGFPVHLLPKPVPLDTIVGRSRFQWHAIVPGTPIVVPYGDMESMMFLAFRQHQQNAVVMNMGTSSQFCRLIDSNETKFCRKKSISPYPSLDCYPFTNEHDLVVAASLNGGNVLGLFNTFLRDTVQTLTGGQELTESAIWYKIFKLDSENVGLQHPNLFVRPTVFGERHDPEMGCEIRFHQTIPTLVDLVEAIAEGLISNLIGMMPDLLDLIQNGLITKVICTGSVLTHNPILQRIVEKRFKSFDTHLEIEYLDDCDSDVGCALFATKQLNRI